jgi:hypothetical protein
MSLMGCQLLGGLKKNLKKKQTIVRAITVCNMMLLRSTCVVKNESDASFGCCGVATMFPRRRVIMKLIMEGNW